MEHKPGFYFTKLKNNLGCVIGLVNPNGVCEKIYIGDSELLNKFVLSDEWYLGVISDLSNWEYIGL